MHRYSAAPQEALIGNLNPIVKGWANYYRTVEAKACCAECDHRLYSMLRSWAKRRHPNKTLRWVTTKYWGVNQGKGWTCMTQDGSVLKKHTATQTVRYVKVKGAASPYDGKLV